MRGLNILKQGTGNKDFDKALELQQKELLQYELKENVRAKYESEMTKAYIQGFAEKNNMDYNSLYQNYKDRKVGDFLNDIDTDNVIVNEIMSSNINCIREDKVGKFENTKGILENAKTIGDMINVPSINNNEE